jgi:TonB family protein
MCPGQGIFEQIAIMMAHAVGLNRFAAAVLAVASLVAGAPRAHAAGVVYGAEWEIMRGLDRAVLPAAPASDDEGLVIVRIVVEEDGSVGYVKAQDGPGPLRKVVETAVREWRFTPFRYGDKTVRVDVEFGIVDHAAEKLYFVQGPEGAYFGPPGATIAFENQKLSKDASREIGVVPFPKADNTLGETPSFVEKAQRVSGGVMAGKAKYRPQPPYPAAARRAGVEGAVVVEVTVSKEGYVLCARPVSGPPLLQIAAVGAGRRWRFSPTTIDGEPVVVIGTITFHFARS